MGALEHNLISGLLLSVLTFVLAMSILIVYLVLRLRQRESALAQFQSEPIPLPRAFVPRRHFALKRPDCWLAVRHGNLYAVQSALALQDVQPCSWADGLAGGSEPKLFISPPISGWILVMGSALPNPCDDEDTSFRFLMELSRKLGHVQFFASSEVFNQHAWVRMEMGHVSRAYAWAGKTLWNQGELTEAEKSLRMKCYPYAQSPGGNPFANHESNSDKVHLLAARWSLDPEEIDDQLLDQALGVVGEPIHHF